MTTMRRMRNSFAVSVVFLTLSFAGVARAASSDSVPAGKLAVLTFDPADTRIAFTLTGWPHTSRGTFKLQRGTISVNPVNGKMDGKIVVAAATGNSGHSIRDARMKDSILEVQRFPYITFAPQQVESHGPPRGEFPVELRGIMTLHGAQHPFTVDAKVERHGDTVSIDSRFKIPYVAWGLENPTILFFTVSKIVDLHVTAIAHLTWISPTPGSDGVPESIIAKPPASN